MSKKILGIDPGFAILGWGFIEGEGISRVDKVEWGAITTSPKETIDKRLLVIYNELSNIIKMYDPDEISLEKLFFNTNSKTVISVGQSQGIALVLAALNNKPIYQYTPLQVKNSLTGYGVSNKKQIQNMLKLVLKLDEIPKPDDAADGIALALCHLQTNRYI